MPRSLSTTAAPPPPGTRRRVGDHTMVREVRTVPVAEVRVDEDNPGRFRAAVLTYGVIDDYATVFETGVFTESMDRRMPRIVWGHNWLDPIGRWIDYEDTDEHLYLDGELDLTMIGDTSTPAVPRAHQALAQLRSRTIDQFSVGFWRIDERDGKEDYGPGVTVITKGDLDEASLVLVGAVPDTHLVDAPRSAMALSVRMPGQSDDGPGPVVPVEEATKIVLQMQSGELDLADGLSALKAAATDAQPGEGDENPPEGGDQGGSGDASEPPADPPPATPEGGDGGDTDPPPGDPDDAGDPPPSDDEILSELDNALAITTGGTTT